MIGCTKGVRALVSAPNPATATAAPATAPAAATRPSSRGCAAEPGSAESVAEGVGDDVTAAVAETANSAAICVAAALECEVTRNHI